MQVTVESTGELERRLRVEIPEERIEGEINDRLQSMRRKVRVPGFRPGKVPLKVVAQRYGRRVRDEVVGEMVQSTFYDALAKENLRPAGSPRIEPEDGGPGQGVSYTAVFEVYPEIGSPRVQGLKVTRPVAEVTEEDVDRMLETLREQRKRWEPVERSAQEGDRVVIDFEGRIDGEPFEGGSATEVPVMLGTGRSIPGLEEGLVGAQADQERALELQLPETYRVERLAGKPVTFQVKVHSVQEAVLPEVDEAFARDLGLSEGGVEALRAEVRNNMERELQQTIRSLTKQRIMDALLEANPVEPPTALVQEEMDRMCNLRRAELAQQGIDPERLGLEPAMFEEQARRRIALGLLLAEIVKRNALSADKDKVRERIESVASTYEDPSQVIKWYYADNSRLAEVESTVLEDQVVDWMLDQVEVEEERSSFDALLNPGQTSGEPASEKEHASPAE